MNRAQVLVRVYVDVDGRGGDRTRDGGDLCSASAARRSGIVDSLVCIGGISASDSFLKEDLIR